MTNDIMKLVLDRMLTIRDTREDIQKGRFWLNKFKRGYGLCSNISDCFGDGVASLIGNWLQETFVSFGLDPNYPVIDDVLDNQEAYQTYANLYIGDYGERRWLLLDLLIAEAEKFISESGESDD